MDYFAHPWTTLAGTTPADAPVKGNIAMACMTYQYLGAAVTDERRVPLLLTRDFVFAGTHAVEAAVRSFAEGGSLRQIRDRAAQEYADGESRPVKVVGHAFINPGDKRWGQHFE